MAYEKDERALAQKLQHECELLTKLQTLAKREGNKAFLSDVVSNLWKVSNLSCHKNDIYVNIILRILSSWEFSVARIIKFMINAKMIHIYRWIEFEVQSVMNIMIRRVDSQFDSQYCIYAKCRILQTGNLVTSLFVKNQEYNFIMCLTQT